MHWLCDALLQVPAVLAQQMPPPSSESWFDRIVDIDTGKLAILLIFGTGFVSAVIYGVASLVRAYHGAPDESEELAERLTELENRVSALEKRPVES